MDIISFDINIPAYDRENNGLAVRLTVKVRSGCFNQTVAKGRVAEALKKNYKRCIEIMTSLKKSWGCLEKVSYILECERNEVIVRDAKSSSMAICIVLINISRTLNLKSSIMSLSGTGILRADGSFNHSSLEEKKYIAAKKSIPNLKKFITPTDCKNLFELEDLIDKLCQ